MPIEPSAPAMEPAQDIPSVHEAKRMSRLARAALKRTKAEAKVAKQRVKLAAKERKLELRGEQEKTAAEDLQLARRGYRRDIFGRIVAVKASRRARAHTRRIGE